MDRYQRDEWTATPGFDAGQFADVQLAGNLLQIKESHASFWHTIGIGGSFTAAPLLYQGKVYVGAHDRNFYCLSLEGEELWRFQGNANFSWEATGDSGMVYVGNFDGNLYALDAETGELRWKFSTTDKIYSSAVPYEGKLYFGSCDGNLYCVDQRTGRELWRFRTTGPVITPGIHNRRLYFGYGDSTLYCVDLTGQEVWRFRVGQGRAMCWPLACGFGMVFIGSDDRNVYALDERNGSVVWKFRAQDTTYSPKLLGDRLYVGGRDNSVYCLDAKTGTRVWTFKTQGFTLDVVPTPKVTYAGSWDTNVYALDTATGQLLWKFKTDGFIGFMTFAEGRLLFGSWDCNVYCLDTNGSLLWRFHSSMSSPSQIPPPESASVASVQVVHAAEEEQKEKSRYGDSFAAEGGRRSVYSFKSQYTTKSKYATKEE